MSPLRHESRILLYSLGAGLPAIALVLVFLWTGDLNPQLRWLLLLSVAGTWLGLAFAVRRQVIRPLQTIANMLHAIHEGDYSIRVRDRHRDDALGLALAEVNTLGETLRRQRLDAVEATALLSKVIEEIDVAVFTFDRDRRLTLVNRGGERLLGRSRNELIGHSAEALHLEHCLAGAPHRILDTSFSGRMGRWELRRSRFREGGLPHQLVVLTDLTRALRQEERQAWQRLVQVLRHEINNSLAPIRSLAGTMNRLLDRDPRPADWEMDLKRGLSIIGERSGALGRFMASYSKLTRLPEPDLRPVPVPEWVEQTVRLETRLPVTVAGGEPVTIEADRTQLDQLLINLVQNAADAALETGGGVRIGWGVSDDGTRLDLWIEDDGPGLTNTDNLFVPFFTTKPNGSGIGLVLSRQIAEAHGGTLTLENREGTPGCIVHVQLPTTGGATTL